MRRWRMERRWPEEAELPVLRCPCCGEELGWRDEIYAPGVGGTAKGCSRCLRGWGAVEWYAEELDLPLCL